MTTAKKQTEINQVFAATLFEVCKLLKSPQLEQQLAADLGHIEAKSRVDGRAHAWDDARREAFGAKIKAAFAAKRDAQGKPDVFYIYKFCDEKPVVVQGKVALAEASGLALKTVSNRLSTNSDGFTIWKGRHHIVFARSEEARDRLCQAPFLLSGNSDDLIVLPSKKSNRF